ncbi:hypothetical protein Peur_066934 [Populus x canadensis]
MAGAAAGKEKRKLTTVEQDLLPIEELVDAGQKSTTCWSRWSSSTAAGLSSFTTNGSK